MGRGSPASLNLIVLEGETVPERRSLVLVGGLTLAVLVWVFAFFCIYFFRVGSSLGFKIFSALVFISLIGALSVGLSSWSLSRIGSALTLGISILFIILAAWAWFELASI